MCGRACARARVLRISPSVTGVCANCIQRGPRGPFPCHFLTSDSWTPGWLGPKPPPHPMPWRSHLPNLWLLGHITHFTDVSCPCSNTYCGALCQDEAQRSPRHSRPSLVGPQHPSVSSPVTSASLGSSLGWTDCFLTASFASGGPSPPVSSHPPLQSQLWVPPAGSLALHPLPPPSSCPLSALSHSVTLT